MSLATTAAAAEVLAALPGDTSGREAWRALGDAGCLAGCYQRGDPAAGIDAGRLNATLAAADARLTIGATLALCVQAATPLPLLADCLGSDSPVVADVLAGRAAVALAATDAGCGSDLPALATEVSVHDDHVVISGAKRWITGATSAEYLLVLARHRPGRHFTNFTWVLVPASAPGVRTEPADTTLFDGSDTGHIALRDVRLPRASLVGRPGLGLASFATHIAVERLAGAQWGVALCRRVLTDTKRRMMARGSGDATLWHEAGLRRRFAACLVAVRQLKALTDELAGAVAERHDTTAAALLKSAAATTVELVLRECAQFQGAEGFTAGGVQLLRAEAALWSIGGGALEVVRNVIGESADAVLADLAP